MFFWFHFLSLYIRLYVLYAFVYFCELCIKWNVWRLAVRYLIYIYDVSRLRVNIIINLAVDKRKIIELVLKEMGLDLYGSRHV
jgi:hypothetical protein